MFEAGDIVRVIAEPPANRHGACWVFIPDMDRTCGQEAMIYNVAGCSIGGSTVYWYRLMIGSRVRSCCYEEAWLIPVKVAESLTKEQFDEDFGELIAGVF